ncbi:MAG TPA: hypothetical protein PKA42_02970 [Candidatus Paceibacterota bacterium]|nr:hypothetical protein [Candidatus Paceibacterota bacterium]HMO83107.1 hypothetical protein [Candidatus Paceibacterota bacterium]
MTKKRVTDKEVLEYMELIKKTHSRERVRGIKKLLAYLTIILSGLFVFGLVRYTLMALGDVISLVAATITLLVYFLYIGKKFDERF